MNSLIGMEVDRSGEVAVFSGLRLSADGSYKLSDNSNVTQHISTHAAVMLFALQSTNALLPICSILLFLAKYFAKHSFKGRLLSRRLREY